MKNVVNIEHSEKNWFKKFLKGVGTEAKNLVLAQEIVQKAEKAYFSDFDYMRAYDSLTPDRKWSHTEILEQLDKFVSDEVAKRKESINSIQ